MFNKVVLVGNLTRDIELRYTTTGSAIGNSAIAVTRKFTTNGERREETCFIDITFFGKQAEIANQYLNKGSKLLVEGRLKFEQWTDSNGQNRSKHTVTVENMEMLGGGQNPQVGYNSQGNQGYNGGHNNQNNYSNQDNYGNSNSNYGGYNQGYQNQGNYQQQQQRMPQRQSEPEIDIDKYDNDETIPF